MTVRYNENSSPLRAARLRAGLSMEELAVRAGISRSILYWAEKQPASMSERTLLACAKVLKLDPKELRP